MYGSKNIEFYKDLLIHFMKRNRPETDSTYNEDNNDAKLTYKHST